MHGENLCGAEAGMNKQFRQEFILVCVAKVVKGQQCGRHLPWVKPEHLGAVTAQKNRKCYL